MKTSAEQLEGKVLDGGWTILNRIDLDSVTTGGCFSEAYIVCDDSGRRAFLKALDYSRAMKAPDSDGTKHVSSALVQALRSDL